MGFLVSPVEDAILGLIFDYGRIPPKKRGKFPAAKSWAAMSPATEKKSDSDKPSRCVFFRKVTQTGSCMDQHGVHFRRRAERAIDWTISKIKLHRSNTISHCITCIISAPQILIVQVAILLWQQLPNVPQFCNTWEKWPFLHLRWPHHRHHCSCHSCHNWYQSDNGLHHHQRNNNNNNNIEFSISIQVASSSKVTYWCNRLKSVHLSIRHHSITYHSRSHHLPRRRHHHLSHIFFIAIIRISACNSRAIVTKSVILCSMVMCCTVFVITCENRRRYR